MALMWTLLQKIQRLPAYIVVVVVLCVWLSLVDVAVVTADRSRSLSPADLQPMWIGAGNRALMSAAGSTFEAMLARRNRSVLADNVQRSTSDVNGNENWK